MKKSPYQLIFTCEHGGNLVPAKYQSLFKNQKKLLSTHRGHDPGALELAKKFAKAFDSPLFFSTTTRLLADLNRSITNETLFSEIIDPLNEAQKKEILDRHYYPYRTEVENFVKNYLKNKKNKPLLHISVHSFTPILNGIQRKADIGLLYDPKYEQEKDLCGQWKNILEKAPLPLIIRKNYPYKGNSDGLTTHLRSVYGGERYLGIELEVNQKFPLRQKKDWQEIQKHLVQSLQTLIG